MPKIRDDVDLKELERFHFTHHDKQDAKICYYRPMPLVKKKIPILVEIFKDRTIDFQLPLDCTIEKQEICLEEYIQDLIRSNLVVKE